MQSKIIEEIASSVWGGNQSYFMIQLKTLGVRV